MLNQRSLDSARKRRVAGHLWSSSPTGFGARVMSSGAASFVFSYRAGSGRDARKRTLTIGNAGNLSVEEAKAIALKHAAAVAGGADPAADRDEQRARQAAAKGETIAILIPAFIQQHHEAQRHRQSKEVRRCLDADAVRRWAAKPVGDIAPTDVTRLLGEVFARGAPAQARRLYVNLNRFFRWCVENHFIAVSPMHSVAKPHLPRARDRVLTDEELALLWGACGALHPSYAACVRFMMLTGCRRNEAARARWDEFDLETGVWKLPADRSKNGRPHTTHLPVQAMRLLQGLSRSSEFIFTARGNGPLTGFSKLRTILQAAISKEAEASGYRLPTDGWVLHDLRRSLVSWLAGNGVAVHVADRLLNHVSGSFGGVVGIYQRYEFATERRNALAAWANHIEALATKKPAASNVVTLNAA